MSVHGTSWMKTEFNRTGLGYADEIYFKTIGIDDNTVFYNEHGW